MNLVIPCVLALLKNNDSPLNEFVDYYLDLGFKHIFIVSYNDINQECVNNNENVTFIKFDSSSHSSDADAYNYGLRKVKESRYNYVLTIETDEFLDLKEFLGIKHFIISEMILKHRNMAEFVWEVYDDNDIVYEQRKNTSLIDTYTRKQNKITPYDFNKNEVSKSKSLVKVVESLHYEKYIGWPAETNNNGIYSTNHIRHEKAVIKKYKTKCLETYLKNKIKEYKSIEKTLPKSVIEDYFNINKKTLVKLESTKDILNKFGIFYHDAFIDNITKYGIKTTSIKSFSDIIGYISCENFNLDKNVLLVDEKSTIDKQILDLFKINYYYTDETYKVKPSNTEKNRKLELELNGGIIKELTKKIPTVADCVVLHINKNLFNKYDISSYIKNIYSKYFEGKTLLIITQQLNDDIVWKEMLKDVTSDVLCVDEFEDSDKIGALAFGNIFVENVDEIEEICSIIGNKNLCIVSDNFVNRYEQYQVEVETIDKLERKDNFIIYTAYHKEEFIKEYNLTTKGNRYLFNTTKELEEDNINHLSPFLSEFVTYYHAFKNDKTHDYFVFEHYRRTVDENDINFTLLDKGFIQAYELCKSTRFFNLKRFFTETNTKIIENCFLEYIDTIDKGLKDYILNVNYKRFGVDMAVQRSVVALNRKNMLEMCEFIIGFFEFFDKKFNLNKEYVKYEKFIEPIKFGKYSKLYFFNTFLEKKRVLSFIGEILVSIFCKYKNNFFLQKSIAKVH